MSDDYAWGWYGRNVYVRRDDHAPDTITIYADSDDEPTEITLDPGEAKVLAALITQALD